LIWHIKKHVSKLRAHQKLKWLEAWQGDIIARGQYMWESFYRAFTGQTVRNMLGRMSPKKPTGSSLVDFQLERSRSIICRRILQCEITKTCLLMWNYKNTVPKKVISHLQSGLHLSNLFSFPFILLFCSDNDIKLSHSTAPNPLQIKMQGT
jgi:hypothetical protein